MFKSKQTKENKSNIIIIQKDINLKFKLFISYSKYFYENINI